MALSDVEQIKKLFEDSHYILVVFNPRDNGDAAASAAALKHYFDKHQKQADIASSGFVTPKNLHFLSGAGDIKSALAHLQKFIIKVDVSKAPLDTLSYDVKDGWMSIYLTPKYGTITKEELRTAQTTFKYDLVITLNTPDLESLGDIFLNNTDLFYRTPIINIDHQPSNERYGQVNLLDLTATSSGEVLYRLLKQLGPEAIDGESATMLLTSMTIATQSFKNSNITPVTLTVASQLIALGADREKIVQHLYHTRSIPALKLWGQALTHLQMDSSLGLVWTSITRDDFVRSGATADDLKGIIDELISNAPEAKIILLLYEGDNFPQEQKIHCLITTEKNYDALELSKPFAGVGSKKHAVFTLNNKSLKESEEAVLHAIRSATKMKEV